MRRTFHLKRVRRTELPREPRWAVMAVMVVIGLPGCSRSSPTDQVEVRDSSGVRIVESSAPLLPEGSWTVADAPVLRVGGGKSEGAAAEFYWVTGVVPLAGDGIGVANSGPPELRTFSADGEPLWRAGRKGEGPGEFEWIEVLQRVGDTLIAYDDRNGRVSWWGLDGAFLDDRPVLLPPGLPAQRLTWAQDAGFFVATRAGPPLEPERYGLVTGEATYVKLDGTGWQDTVAVAPGDELFLLTPRGGGRTAGFRIAAFAQFEASAVDGDGRVHLRLDRTAQVGVVSPGGRLERIVRWDPGDLTLDDARWVAGLRDLLGDRLRDPSVYDLPRPESVPPIGQMLIDEGGNLWVSEYAQYLNDPGVWQVFDTAGVWQTTVRVPDRFRVFTVTEDRIYGRRKDALDREIVEVLELRRSEGGGAR